MSTDFSLAVLILPTFTPFFTFPALRPFRFHFGDIEPVGDGSDSLETDISSEGLLCRLDIPLRFSYS